LTNEVMMCHTMYCYTLTFPCISEHNFISVDEIQTRNNASSEAV